MMQRSKQIFVPFALLCLATLAITGCGATNTAAPDQPSETSTDATNSATGEAAFEYGESTYTADLQYCSLTDGQDALFHGVAHDDTGNEVGYLDGDFTIRDGNILEGEARIDFGASAQFESTEEFISIGSLFDGIVATAFSDTAWNILGSGWDQDGTHKPNSSLRVQC